MVGLTRAGLGEFLSLHASPELGEPLSSKTIFKGLNISDDNFENILKYIYDFAIKDSSLVTFNNFHEIIIALLTNPNDELFRELLGNLYQSTREKFGHEHYQEDINNYHQKGFDDAEREAEEEEEESLMDILDFLVLMKIES
ncbi:hypothetical protein [Planococcus halocryophilus]|uniref:hypothetical protein n=1 Tax=Planococcus halocryophilus TaxID=1215089 RepID=UPI00138AFDDE|nr:hypothetical protein [Planococcus halocryophilus]